MIPAGGGGQPPYAVTQQQGYMPVHQASSMMSAQPMMHGQTMMPYQTLIPGHQFPVQPPVFNPQLNQGYLVRAPGITPQRVIPPPQYTPQMAQEYRAKQSQHPGQQSNYTEEQRKQMDNLLKQRQFEDQQKRLKEFSSMGGRKMDANSMIESIIGGAAPVKSQSGKNTATASLSQSNATSTHDSAEDDGFGDFIGGPSKSTSVQPRTETENYLPGQQMPVAPSSQSAVISSTQNVLEAGSCNESASKQQTPEPAPSVSTEQKKDLMAMMLECSDLTAPQKAKGFVKKCVKEVQPVKKNTVSYQESQKAHKWDQTTDTLTELFTLPDGNTPGSVFKPPKWVTGAAPVPEVYTLVLEASIVNGLINTERLYPILLRSNLPRETLGQLWALCNKTTPGQLIKEELYLLLAMISIAQNNLDYSSLEILTRCPQAPVPNLGQHVPSLDPSVGQTDPAGHPLSGGPLNVPAAPAPVTNQLADVASISNGNGSINVGDDDFSDFQSGPTVVGPAAQLGGYGDSASSATMACTYRNGSSVPSEKVPASTEHTSLEKGEKDEDIDEYFKNMQPSSSSSRTVNNIDLVDPFKKNSKSKCNVSVKPISAIHRLETTFPISSDTEAFTTNTDAALPDFESFAAFPGSQSESSSSQSQGWASSSSLSGVTSASSNMDDIADFASAGTATPADDFADFQQAPSIGITQDKGTDKISALKALIMNKDLYLEKPKGDLKPVSDDDMVKEGDWNTYSSADGQKGLADGCSSLSQEDVTPIAQPSATMGFFSDSIAVSVNEKKQNDWAVFITPTKPGPDLTAVVGLESAPVTEEKQYESTVCDKLPNEDSKKEERLKVDKAKSEKLFQKNLSNTASSLVVPALAAFELVPPELPEVKDDEGDEFDEFGTFQGGIGMTDATNEGISALAMGLDDLPDFNFVNAKSSQLPSQNSGMNTACGKDTLDTISTASQEFSGWRNQTKSSQKEDTQSMNSLDLRVSHKDESPSSADCQSVSSLEFSAGDASRKSATPMDQRSVTSLELKTTSDPGSDDVTPDLPAGSNESVNGSAVLSQPFPCDPSKPAIKSPVDWNFDEKPRDVSELLTQGGLPAIGDRYSGLTQEPQDTDKHTYHWQRCLEKNKQVLTMAMEIFQSVSESDIAEEIVNSEKGSQYMKGIVEVYRVFCRIKQAMKCFSISNRKLESLVEVIEDTWASLTIFIANTALMPERAALDFSKDVLKTESEDNQKKACGVCVLNVDVKSELSNFNNQHKLTYGGRQYHSSCANFWVNCVDSTLPSLSIPELL